MGRICSWPSSRPACTALARPGLCSACGPQLLWKRPTCTIGSWPMAVRRGGPRPRGAPGRSACGTRARRRGMHARWRGDFTDAGGWSPMSSEQRRSTRMERRPRRRYLPTHGVDGKSGGAQLGRGGGYGLRAGQ
jgi:hypothetical protein